LPLRNPRGPDWTRTPPAKCVPFCMTLGGLLQRLEQEKAQPGAVVLVMPTTVAMPLRRL